MTFQDDMQNDIGTLLNSDEFAEAVTYTPLGGVAKNISAVIDRMEYQTEFGEDGESLTKEAMVDISTDVTGGIADPAIADSVTFDSITWRVKAVALEPIQAMAKLTVARYDAIEKSGPGYRNRR